MKFWRRNFALKIYAEFYAVRVPLLRRDFYGRLVRMLLMRRCKLKSLQSCGAVKFYAYENTYRAATYDICARFIVLKFYFG